MSPAERAFWQRAQRRALGFQPDIAEAILRAFGMLRDSMSEAELARLVASGDLDRLFRELFSDDIMDRALQPVRQRIRQAIEKHVPYFAADLPKAGKINGVLAISFDYLNPNAITAIRRLETKVIRTLKDDVRETVRAFVENGLRDGVNPRAVGRQIRTIIGLAPNQELAVRNFEQALRGDGRNPLDYKLRDKRFDGTIRKGALTESQIETQAAAYRRKMIAFNANTNARTAALDAMKLGQRLAWEDAVDKGIVDRARLTKKWVGVMDDRERPEHRALQGETAGFDETFSNGETIPGDSTFNCRCLARYMVA